MHQWGVLIQLSNTDDLLDKESDELELHRFPHLISHHAMEGLSRVLENSCRNPWYENFCKSRHIRWVRSQHALRLDLFANKVSGLSLTV